MDECGHADEPDANPESASVESAHDVESASTPARRPRQRRRATTPPPPGSDPSPIAEPQRHRLDENDARLTAEKPPHY